MLHFRIVVQNQICVRTPLVLFCYAPKFPHLKIVLNFSKNEIPYCNRKTVISSSNRNTRKIIGSTKLLKVKKKS